MNTLLKKKNELSTHPEKFGDAFHFIVKTFFPNLL